MLFCFYFFCTAIVSSQHAGPLNICISPFTHACMNESFSWQDFSISLASHINSTAGRRTQAAVRHGINVNVVAYNSVISAIKHTQLTTTTVEV